MAASAFLLGCAGDDQRDAVVPTSTTIAVEPWSVVRPTFEGSAGALWSIEAVEGGYLAAGKTRDGLTIWSSSGLEHFEQRWSTRSEGMDVRDARIRRIGGRALLAASGLVRDEHDEWTSQSWLWTSDDEGVSWTEVDAAGFLDAGSELAQLERIEDGAVARIWVPSTSAEIGGSTEIWFSPDLESWAQVEIVGLEEDRNPQVVTDGHAVWVYAQRWDPASGAPVLAAWHWAPGGDAFDRLPEVSADASMVVAVDGSLFAWAKRGMSVDYIDPERDAETGPWRLTGGRWRLLESDTGQWGDAGPGTPRLGVDHAPDGRLVATIGRGRRSNPHYCYPDPAMCDVSELRVITSADGDEWFDLAGADLSGQTVEQLVVGLDGSIVVWGTLREQERGSIDGAVLTLWPGPGLPARLDPAADEPPDRSVPMYREGPLDEGEERRFVLRHPGSCGQTYVHANDQFWLLEPPDSAVPRGWPAKPAPWWPDRPTLLYGRIRITGPDELRFWAEGVDEWWTFRPINRDELIMCH